MERLVGAKGEQEMRKVQSNRVSSEKCNAFLLYMGTTFKKLLKSNIGLNK